VEESTEDSSREEQSALYPPGLFPLLSFEFEEALDPEPDPDPDAESELELLSSGAGFSVHVVKFVLV